jgi:type I restriction enzyme S subunit
MQCLIDRASANWPVVKLGELFSNRKAKGKRGLPTYSVTMGNGLVLRDSLDRKNDTSLKPEQHLLIEEGDIAYNMMRMWQGASGLATDAGLVSPAYVVIRSRGTVDPAFASYWFKMPRVVKKFQDYSHGLTEDRLRLYYKDFATITLPLPPLKLQQQIAKAMQCCDRELDALQRKVALLKQQKKGLMQQLLTGKTRVKLPKGAA